MTQPLPLCDYVAKQEAIQGQMEALRKQGKAVLVKALNALFEKYPALYRVRWTQCTPYFNDGDPCDFSSHAEDADINDDDDFGVDDDNDGECRERDDKCEAAKFTSDEEELACRDEAHTLLKCFSDQDYYHFFGDHMVVDVTRKGVETYEYSHD